MAIKPTLMKILLGHVPIPGYWLKMSDSTTSIEGLNLVEILWTWCSVLAHEGARLTWLGEVVAKMECEFEESKTKEQIKTNTSTD